MLTLAMVNKLRCHAHFLFLANHITWSRLLIQIHLLYSNVTYETSDSQTKNYNRGTTLEWSMYVLGAWGGGEGGAVLRSQFNRMKPRP